MSACCYMYVYSVDRWMSEMFTQVIVPTARFTGRECTLPKHHSVIVVPHSDHCSYDELLEFVKLVKPVSIQPIVHIKDCLNMNRFDPFLTDRPQVRPNNTHLTLIIYFMNVFFAQCIYSNTLILFIVLYYYRLNMLFHRV